MALPWPRTITAGPTLIVGTGVVFFIAFGTPTWLMFMLFLPVARIWDIEDTPPLCITKNEKELP